MRGCFTFFTGHPRPVEDSLAPSCVRTCGILQSLKKQLKEKELRIQELERAPKAGEEMRLKEEEVELLTAINKVFAAPL